MEPSQIKVTIDFLGDLKLIVPPSTRNVTEVIFQVSSHSLRLASPVWNVMLTRGFKESQQDEIRLFGDDPECLSIVLNGIHHNNEYVPDRMEPEKLVSLVELCDKYDVLSIFGLRISSWLDQISSNDTRNHLAELLQVEWIIRRQDKVEKLAMELTQRISISGLNESDESMFSIHPDISCLSPSIQDGILEARRAILNFILADEIPQILKGLQEGMESQCAVDPAHLEYKTKCHSVFCKIIEKKFDKRLEKLLPTGGNLGQHFEGSILSLLRALGDRRWRSQESTDFHTCLRDNPELLHHRGCFDWARNRIGTEVSREARKKLQALIHECYERSFC